MVSVTSDQKGRPMVFIRDYSFRKGDRFPIKKLLLKKSEKGWSKESMKREDAARLLAEELGTVVHFSATVTESASESSSDDASDEDSSQTEEEEEQDEQDEEEEDEEAKSKSKKRPRARSLAAAAGRRPTKKLKAASEEKQMNAQGLLEQFHCSECTATFTSKLKHTNHLQLHKEGLLRHVCERCGRQMRHKSDLKSHMKTHTREKPFKCSLCEYTCTLKNHLKNHMRTHRRKAFQVLLVRLHVHCKQRSQEALEDAHRRKVFQVLFVRVPVRCKQRSQEPHEDTYRRKAFQVHFKRPSQEAHEDAHGRKALHMLIVRLQVRCWPPTFVLLTDSSIIPSFVLCRHPSPFVSFLVPCPSQRHSPLPPHAFA
eukprot:g68913.t1